MNVFFRHYKVNVKKHLEHFLEYSNDEKQELSKLNSKMNSYLSRVKMLETENTRLLMSIGQMQTTWGDESRKVREEFEQNLLDTRQGIDEISHLKTVSDIRHKRWAYGKWWFSFLI
jgi:predicted nuclease with TOPRIM domain